MKQSAQNSGLYCRAVKTDMETLKSLYGCEVILHIPGKNHFVVLGDIDSSYVWSIDLTNNKFFYRTDLNFFDMDWTEGTALLVSDQPIQIQGNFTEIAEAGLHTITGGAGYSCTRLLQGEYIVLCDYALGECAGYYEIHFERWGCEAAESGSCRSSWMHRAWKCPCIEDPYDPLNCIGNEDWTVYWMRACA